MLISSDFDNFYIFDLILIKFASDLASRVHLSSTFAFLFERLLKKDQKSSTLMAMDALSGKTTHI